MNNKNGFTLIELIAVIVILGILMIIAIPAVTRYIDNSKKRTYITTIKNITDTVRYGVTSGDSNYEVKSGEQKKFYFKDIETEKGKITKSPHGDFIDSLSYVLVINDNGNYTYKVQAKDNGGYAVPLTNANELSIEKIKLYDNLTSEEKLSFPEYKVYSIGDSITYNGSSWYVINNSNKEEDYVVLLKQSVLTKTELGEYASVHICTSNDVNQGHSYGCNTVGEKIEYYAMEYSWSETCHNADHGYTTTVITGCATDSNIATYDNSKIKKFLEEKYIKTLQESNLKEVDGYKIRLITKEELTTNLGYSKTEGTTSAHTYTENTPQFVYQGYGEGQNKVSGYWTMTHGDCPWSVWYIASNVLFDSQNCNVNANSVLYYYSVRPVINLLKSAIIEN